MLKTVLVKRLTHQFYRHQFETTLSFRMLKTVLVKRLTHQFYRLGNVAQASVGYSPYGKTGAGNYGQTLGKQHVTYMNPVRDRMMKLIKTIPFPDNRSFNLADYGTADGSASMPFIRDLLVTLREHHGPKSEFQVIYEDRENNDFNSLFKRLSGIIPDPPSYMLELDNVYPMASGINFWKQCVPTGSMDFIMTSLAVQWLSKPLKYKKTVYAFPDGTEEEKNALDQQSRADWESFLLLRSKELAKGGVFLSVATGAYTDDNGVIHFTVRTFIRVLSEVWASFQKSGKITAEEFTNTSLGLCMYSLQQLEYPFNSQSDPVPRSGLRLLLSELYVAPDVFYTAWKEKKDLTGEDDREEFAKKYTSAHRNWSHTGFSDGLSEQRSQEEREKIVDDFYCAVEKKIAKMDPREFKDDLLISIAIVRKE